MSEPIMTIKPKCGGTVRIMPDCLPKTAEERAQREAAVWRAACEILANAAARHGIEDTREKMLNGPHAELFRTKTGRITA